ncbi:MAG: hypothetical protein IKP00_14175 [Victivallales bacterium]|jgi:hypothetical protein|nr:hypothetical protein [Victivallales bacterium]
MIANIIIGLIIVCLFVLAVRYALKKHHCDGCCNCGCGSRCCDGKKVEKNKTVV